MAKGDSARLGYASSVGISEETTFGTKVDSGAYIEFMSESLKMNREEKLLDGINGTRSFIKRKLLNKTVDGSLEMEFNPASDACAYILKQAMGGTCSSATQASSDIIHTIYTGDMESNAATSTASNVKSLSLQVDKGGLVYDFTGCRVSNLTLKAEVGGMAMMTAELVGKSSSLTSSTPTAVFSNIVPVDFVGCSFGLGDSLGNLTTESIQAFELTINNNLNSDQRSLGSSEIDVLPPQMREISLKVTQRFDTTTNYTQFIQETISSIRLTMDTQVTITASTGSDTYKLLVDLPRVYTNGPAIAEVGGPDVLTHEIEYRPISQNTSTAYDIRMSLYNLTANYE